MQSDDLAKTKAELSGSLILFTQTFYKILHGRDFNLSNRKGGESHLIKMSRYLTKSFRGETTRLIMACPPGWHKSTMCRFFVAWAMAQYPDSQILYVSFSHERAAENTHGIKQIMSLPHYRKIFGVEISSEVKAKDKFKTTAGGMVSAYGSSGGITGADCGLPHLDRFSGCMVIDDIHKPDEVNSDSIRERVINNYHGTLDTRFRSPTVPRILIGHRLREDDLTGRLLEGMDGHDWESVIFTPFDEAGNEVYPEVSPRDKMIIKSKIDPYTYASQYLQNPTPPGGGVFKKEYFRVDDFDQEMICTFMTIDTAETNKDYNDATVFSFWGVHHIKNSYVETGQYGLRWIDCLEVRIEPKDLYDEFLQFYSACMRYKVPPNVIAIEKKSTGVTLSSIMKEMRGVRIMDINRTRASGSKSSRYLEASPYVASGLISLPMNAKHTKMCIEHCSKITLNDTHRHDDIADTLYDAIKIALIDKTILAMTKHSDTKKDDKLNYLSNQINRLNEIRSRSLK